MHTKRQLGTHFCVRREQNIDRPNEKGNKSNTRASTSEALEKRKGLAFDIDQKKTRSEGTTGNKKTTGENSTTTKSYVRLEADETRSEKVKADGGGGGGNQRLVGGEGMVKKEGAKKATYREDEVGVAGVERSLELLGPLLDGEVGDAPDRHRFDVG